MQTKKDRVWQVAAILPAFLLFLTFTYYPLLSTMRYSVTDWNGFSRVYNFVGLDNFIQLFQDASIWQAFFNTTYFAIISIIVGTVLQLGLAVILYGKFKGRRFFRALFYMPCVISQMIASLTWLSFFQYTGVLNALLQTIGLEKIDLLGNPDTVKNVLVFINAWQWTGYGMVIYLAGLTSVPTDVYEAARLDGASGMKQFFKITLPLIMPSVTINLFIGITGALKIFDMPFVLTKGGPMGASQMLSMSIYENAFSYEQFGYASAIGVLFFLLIAGVTVAQVVTTRRNEVEY